MQRPRIALALGSGSARGWAHIGVLRELQAAGIEADVVAGTSIGALVGAAYAANELDALEGWVTKMGWRDVLALVDPVFAGGLLKGDRLMTRFGAHFDVTDFSGMSRPFGCVATDLSTGHEIWLREGKVLDAVRASIAMPGLFSPVKHNGGFLVDGALVNPVPVSLARAMGGQIVIAVELGADLVGYRRRQRQASAEQVNDERGGEGEGDASSPSGMRWFDSLRKLLPARIGNGDGAESGSLPVPTILDVMNTSINIMQVRIARSRLAGEPADVLVQPRLATIGLLDFHRAEESIAEGRAAMRLVLPAVHRLLE
ncbi:MAG TPA: patatin-like phospholipase RssA [Rhodocyclaceae bacterium]